jgi:hypothetical protein
MNKEEWKKLIEENMEEQWIEEGRVFNDEGRGNDK